MTVQQVLTDDAASYWIKDALRKALARDPLDAARDAEVLYELLAERAERDLAETTLGIVCIRLGLTN